MKRNLAIGGSFLAVLAALWVAQGLAQQSAAAQSTGRADGPAIRGGSHLPQAAPERLVSGPDHRPVGGCPGPRLDRPPARRARRRRRRVQPDAADRRMLQHRRPDPRVRSGRQPAAPLGRQGRPGLSVARLEPRPQHRQQGQHLDWRQRRHGRPRPEVHARRQVRDAGGQEGRDPQQPGRGSLLPGGQDVLLPADRRSVRGRRLRQPARGGDRRADGQDEAVLGRLRQAAGRQGRTGAGPVRRHRHLSALPRPGALRRRVERRPGLRVRPHQQPAADLQGGRHVRERGLHGARLAGRRRGVGHGVLARSRSSGTSTWPTAATRRCASSTASRWRS